MRRFGHCCEHEAASGGVGSVVEGALRLYPSRCHSYH